MSHIDPIFLAEATELLERLEATLLELEGGVRRSKGADAAAVTRAIEAFCGLGRDHLRKAREAGGISTDNFPAFLPVAVVPHILAKAEKLGAALLDRQIQPAQWRRQWWMWRALRRQSF